MRELTKRAVETLYQEDLKHRLEEAFGTLMVEMKELPDDIYAQYATNALRNLIQLSAKGVTDLNVFITEYLNDSNVLYANYEETLKEIKALDEIALSKKYEQDIHYEEYIRKSEEYDRLRKECDEEKGIEDTDKTNDSSISEQGTDFGEKVGHNDESNNQQ